MEGGRGKRIIRMEKSCDECTASLASFLSRRFSSMRLIAILEVYENKTVPLSHSRTATGKPTFSERRVVPATVEIS